VGGCLYGEAGNDRQVVAQLTFKDHVAVANMAAP
jgi:hypothetical protein